MGGAMGDVSTMQPKASPSKRDLERVLRGAGLTARQAKRLLASGYTALGTGNSSADIEALADQAEALARQLRNSCREISQG